MSMGQFIETLPGEPCISCSHWGMFLPAWSVPMMVPADDAEVERMFRVARPGHIVWVKEKH